jgi:hypothetical protein
MSSKGTGGAVVGYGTGMWEAPRPSNRRIGERVAVEPIPVTLVLEGSGARRGLRRRPTQLPGRIVDVSVSGVAIECEGAEQIPNRTLVSLDVNGTVSTARVVRSSAKPGGGRVYGLAFVRLDPRLQEELYAVLGSGRPVAELWFRAR